MNLFQKIICKRYHWFYSSSQTRCQHGTVILSVYHTFFECKRLQLYKRISSHYLSHLDVLMPNVAVKQLRESVFRLRWSLVFRAERGERLFFYVWNYRLPRCHLMQTRIGVALRNSFKAYFVVSFGWTFFVVHHSSVRRGNTREWSIENIAVIVTALYWNSPWFEAVGLATVNRYRPLLCRRTQLLITTSTYSLQSLRPNGSDNLNRTVRNIAKIVRCQLHISLNLWK